MLPFLRISLNGIETQNPDTIFFFKMVISGFPDDPGKGYVNTAAVSYDYFCAWVIALKVLYNGLYDGRVGDNAGAWMKGINKIWFDKKAVFFWLITGLNKNIFNH